MPNRTIGLVVPLMALVACSNDGPGPVEAGVTVRDVSLPVAGAVYRGAAPHVFLDQTVTLFCGTHGVFSNAVTPPQTIGGSGLAEYTATFEGELTLEPPAVPSAITHPLTVQARMAESITLVGESADVRTFDTELVVFELQGTGMPDGIMVRESPDLPSAGATTVTALADGRHQIETHYDVWLDISLDGGRTWNQAEQTVRMTLEAS